MYDTPKELFENKRYKGLDLSVKMFYGILYTMARDERDGVINGKPCILVTNDELAELCEISNKTVISYKKQLKEYDLITERRQGLGKPNITIVSLPMSVNVLGVDEEDVL